MVKIHKELRQILYFKDLGLTPYVFINFNFYLFTKTGSHFISMDSLKLIV